MKALLVWAYCLTCNSSTLSITKFDTMSECDAARDAIVANATMPTLFGSKLTFDGQTQPQCIPYVVPW